ncbi:MAG: hypothetical protein K2W96_21050, partial [Gemmataceae bacterium]|nr:hypothetical protein [Gemmataceae bacterium]
SDARVASALGFAVAPCPACGHIQPEMRPWARSENAPVVRLAVLGGLLLFCSAIAFAVVQNVLVSDRGGAFVAWPYYLGLLGAVSLGSLLLLWSWLRSRHWNPDRIPLGKRLALAKQVCLTEAQVERLCGGFVPHPPDPIRSEAP